MITHKVRSDGPGTGNRRRFLELMGSTTIFITAGGLFDGSAEATVPATEPTGEVELYSPTETLMRDHGLLKRMLLIYGECIRQLDSGTELSLDTIANTAKIMKSFIVDHHEKLEEEYIFPAFLKAGKLVDLVNVLSKQHIAGRKLTDMTLSLADTGTHQSQPGKKKLTDSLDLFIRMYSPHEAREDTVLYPAYRSVVTHKEFNAMGAYFVFKQQEHLEKTGFEGLTQQIAEIEKSLGIYDLSQFTARL